MQIIEVNTAALEKTFLNMVNTIYASDKNYIRPLDIMIQDTFNPLKNNLLLNGYAVRYIVVRDQKCVGRVAAFINPKKAFGFEQPTGGIGFFECENNQEAANLLFDASKKWLQNKGMEAMDGPINFGENDNFWGCLIEGFTPPAFGMAYNPNYYQNLFESYGFAAYYNQITNHLDLSKEFPERFWRISERIISKPGLTFKHFTWKDSDRFIDNFIEIYNDAWQFHENFTPIQKSSIKNLIEKTRSFLMPELIWYAYFNDEPIGFLVMFPDANQIIKHLHGKLNWWAKLKFVYYRQTKAMTRTRVTVFGIKTHFQRMGIESGIFHQLRDVVKRNPQFTEMELSWVGDFNPKMRALLEAMGASLGKKHITYRILFNQKQVARSAIIPTNSKQLGKNQDNN